MSSDKHYYIFDEIDIAPLIRLQSDLESSYAAIDTNIEKAGAIKFFEMAYELSWKTIKKLLLIQHGLEIKSGPRDIFREAAKVGYINDPELWFSFIETRNETVHAYNEKTADVVIDKLPAFVSELKVLLENLKCQRK